MKKIFCRIKKIFNRSVDNELTYSEVKNILNNSDSAILIDVRSSQEFKEGHIVNAINLPVYDLENHMKNKVLDKSNVIILYCQTETRSIKAKKILDKMGYANVYVLKGGMDAIL